MIDNWSIVIVNIDGGLIPVKVAENESDFLKTTVKELREKIFAKAQLNSMRLTFAGQQLEDFAPGSSAEKTLEDYNVQRKSTINVIARIHGGSERVPPPPQAVDKEHPATNDFSVFFTNEPDAIYGYSDPGDPKRVKMSCGHGVDPSNLTNYCRAKLKDNIFKFTCPAIVEKPNKACGKEWTYPDIRKAALLNDDEMKYFEYKMSEIAAMQFIDMKECPGCCSYVERIDTQNLRVHCPICTKAKGKTWDFCWHCLKEWSGPSTSNVKCGNPSCMHPELPALKEAPTITLYGKEIPNRRACPTCGKVLEHKQEGCKMITCPRCQKEFCFICLLLSAECLETAPSSWHGECKNPPAPKQTEIPVWAR